MKVFYIFQERSGQIVIYIGSFDSSDAIILINCTDSGYFHILDKQNHPQIQAKISASNPSGKKIPSNILEDLEGLIKKMNEESISHSDHLNKEIMKLDDWFHISELVK